MSEPRLSPADNVCRYLADNGIGEFGTDITSNHWPDKWVRGVCVYDIAAPQPDFYLPVDYYALHIEVRGSNNDQTTTMNLAMTIWNLLKRSRNIKMADLDVMNVQPLASPQNTGLDNRSRWLITCSYNLRVRVSQ